MGCEFDLGVDIPGVMKFVLAGYWEVEGIVGGVLEVGGGVLGVEGPLGGGGEERLSPYVRFGESFVSCSGKCANCKTDDGLDPVKGVMRLPEAGYIEKWGLLEACACVSAISSRGKK